jgi:hypothetical protein
MFNSPIVKVAPTVTKIRNISDGNSGCSCLMDRFPAIVPTCNKFTEYKSYSNYVSKSWIPGSIYIHIYAYYKIQFSFHIVRENIKMLLKVLYVCRKIIIWAILKVSGNVLALLLQFLEHLICESWLEKCLGCFRYFIASCV